MPLPTPDQIRKAAVIMAVDSAGKQTLIYGAKTLKRLKGTKKASGAYAMMVPVESDEEIAKLALHVTAIRGRNDFGYIGRGEAKSVLQTLASRTAALGDRTAYPGFVVEPNDAPPEFVELVRGALARIDFTDGSSFDPWEQATWLEVRQMGWTKAQARLVERTEKGDAPLVLVEHQFITNIGEQVFAAIGEDVIKRFVPFSDVVIQPHDRVIGVTFRTLRRERGANGSIYYSPHEPKLEGLTVAFSRHAIERVVERFCPNGLTYGAAGDVFAFFNECSEFHPATLYPDQPAFTFFDNCAAGYASQSFAEAVYGELTPGRRYRYRVGYCPVVREGRFLKAKTFLYPGNKATPEYGALLNAGMLPSRKQAMLAQAEAMNAEIYRVGGDEWSLFKWFHRNGVAQVLEGAAKYTKVFAKPETPQ